MGSAASVKEDAAVLVASPALRERADEDLKFRGATQLSSEGLFDVSAEANQDFYEQTMRICSKQDINSRHPGPDFLASSFYSQDRLLM